MSSVTSEEFLWSCELSAANKEYAWAPEVPVKDDVNIVQIESEGYNKEKVNVPVLAMRGGSDLQTFVDILVPSNAKLTIVRGEGPVHLIGSHCIDFFASMDGEADDEEDDDEMEVKGKGDDLPASPIKTKS